MPAEMVLYAGSVYQYETTNKLRSNNNITLNWNIHDIQHVKWLISAPGCENWHHLTGSVWIISKYINVQLHAYDIQQYDAVFLFVSGKLLT